MRRSVFVKKCFDAVWPCLIECDPCDRLQNIDPIGLRANLKSRRGFAIEVSRGHCPERRAVFGESGKNGFAVLLVGLYENVKILGAAWIGVNANRMSANYEILHSVRIKGGEEISLVLEHAAWRLSSDFLLQAAFQLDRTMRTSLLSEGL